MHKRAKLLLACITLLIALTNALATSMEFDSKILLSGSDERTFVSDNLEQNNLILRKCHFSNDTSQISCDISGSPADETTLQKCNVKINVTNSDRVFTYVKDVYRFKDNKLIVHVEDKNSGSSFYIFDNCVLVKTLSSVNSKDGIIVQLNKIVYYEDGFDIAMPESPANFAKMYYQSFDSDGKQISNYIYTVSPEQLSYHTFGWQPNQVSFAKKHSRGVTLSNGYHIYPNGIIVQIARDQRNYEMHSSDIANEVDDGPFYTKCDSFFDDALEIGKEPSAIIFCNQYDVDHARLAFKVSFTTNLQMRLWSLRNLDKGGFLLAFSENSRMTVYVIRPDRTASIDSIDFGKDESLMKVTDFNEKTGEITVLRSKDAKYSSVTGSLQFFPPLTRGRFLLQNYTRQVTVRLYY